MPDPIQPDPERRKPFLGRAIALALAALLGMVALGVAWVWQSAHREQSRRDRLAPGEETFLTPRRP